MIILQRAYPRTFGGDDQDGGRCCFGLGTLALYRQLVKQAGQVSARRRLIAPKPGP